MGDPHLPRSNSMKRIPVQVSCVTSTTSECNETEESDCECDSEFESDCECDSEFESDCECDICFTSESEGEADFKTDSEIECEQRETATIAGQASSSGSCGLGSSALSTARIGYQDIMNSTMESLQYNYAEAVDNVGKEIRDECTKVSPHFSCNPVIRDLGLGQSVYQSIAAPGLYPGGNVHYNMSNNLPCTRANRLVLETNQSDHFSCVVKHPVSLIQLGPPLAHQSEILTTHNIPLSHYGTPQIKYEIPLTRQIVTLTHQRIPPLNHAFLSTRRSVRPAYQRVQLAHQIVQLAHQSVPPSRNEVPQTHNAVPLAHRNVPLAHRNVPLAHRNVPLAHQSVPLAHQSVPLAHRIVTSASKPFKPLGRCLFNPRVSKK